MIHIGDFSTKANLLVIPNTGKIIINKTDEETSKPIEGVTFSLRKSDGTNCRHSYYKFKRRSNIF